MTIAEILLIDYDGEISNTRRTIERLPDNLGDYRPHAKSMKLGKLAMHCARMPLFGLYIVEDEGMDMAASTRPQSDFTWTTTADALSALDEICRRNAARPLPPPTDEHLQHALEVQFRRARSSRMTPARRPSARSFFDHLIHHTAQLGVYLRLNNLRRPRALRPQRRRAVVGPSNQPMQQVGHVTELWCYPVKSMAGQSLHAHARRAFEPRSTTAAMASQTTAVTPSAHRCHRRADGPQSRARPHAALSAFDSVPDDRGVSGRRTLPALAVGPELIEHLESTIAEPGSRFRLDYEPPFHGCAARFTSSLPRRFAGYPMSSASRSTRGASVPTSFSTLDDDKPFADGRLGGPHPATAVP